MNLFEIAAREAFRFQSSKGLITTEQLWDLPLQSKSGFDLDSVAKGINAQIKTMAEESFVPTVRTNPLRAVLEQQLEIIKHIIGVKHAEAEAKVQAASRKAEREKLLAMLEKKQDAALEGMSVEDIKARLAALD